MRKLALVSIAACAAALPLTAQAQPGPAPGHSWREPGQRVLVHRGGPDMRHHRGARRDFRHIRRIDRGHVVPQFWWGPQFEVQHWQTYGFPQPLPGYRWIRYYDDALMIDRRGRVHDGRYGYDWDRHGDDWDYDDRGIPVYVGRGDYHPDERDYDYAEGHGGGWDYREYGDVRGAHYPGCAPAPRGPCGGYAYPAPAPHGYGYGYQTGYGYQSGYGCCGTVTITETTVTTGGAAATEYYEEIIEEEEVVTRPRARRVHRRAPPPRRPIRGERG